jgi:hypothetical protein
VMDSHTKHEIAKELILAEAEIVSGRERLTRIVACFLGPSHPLYAEIQAKRLSLYADHMPPRDELGSDATYFRFGGLIEKLYSEVLP